MTTQRDDGPVWARTPRQRRPALTRDAVVAAAITLADAEGLAAVSIRRVAAELGARTMSLYSHIARKEDLLDLMADEIAGEVYVDAGLPADWRAAVTLLARREREVALRHPWLVDLRSQRPQVGPNGLRHAEQSLAAVRGLGLDPAGAWRVVSVLDQYVLGYVISEVLRRQAGAGDAQADLGPYLEQVATSGDFPNLAPLLADGIPAGDDFEQGLGWLLDGIAAAHGQP